MYKINIAVLATFIGLVCSPSLMGAGLFSATGEVIAIESEELFAGHAEGHLSGAGTLYIRSQKEPGLSCTGQFTSSAKAGGMGQLGCSDGTTATFQFQRLSVYRGYGIANFTRGSMSFAYGFSPEDAGPYLNLPKGKKLTRNGTLLVLVDMRK